MVLPRARRVFAFGEAGAALGVDSSSKKEAWSHAETLISVRSIRFVKEKTDLGVELSISLPAIKTRNFAGRFGCPIEDGAPDHQRR